jgi:hypothetical protein
MVVNNTKKLALLGALAFALSGPVMAQAGGGSSGGVAGAPTEGGMAASGTMGMHKKGTHGTTLHQQDKASHARGASAAAAASALGTNDKGTPQ